MADILNYVQPDHHFYIMAEKETKTQDINAEQNAAASEEMNAPQADRKAAKKEQKKDAKKADELQAKLSETEEKLQKEKDDYMRLMAEFETFRRRTAEDKLNLIASASADTIKGLLPVLDDCERALAILEGSADEAAKEGTGLIYTKLMAYLKTKGLEKIEAKGQKFDTDFHEAVTQFPAPDESMKGCVIDVVQTGYTLNGKVLRYAKVVVGA